MKTNPTDFNILESQIKTNRETYVFIKKDEMGFNKRNKLSLTIVIPNKEEMKREPLTFDQHNLIRMTDIVCKVVTLLWYRTNPPINTHLDCMRRFMMNILSYNTITSHTVFSALFLVKRLVDSIPDGLTFVPRIGSEIRLIVVAFMIADGVNNPTPINYKMWGVMSRIDVKTLYAIKLEFLQAIKWNTSMGEDEYKEWIKTVLKMIK